MNGEIRVEGIAEREVVCDSVRVVFTIKACSAISSKTIGMMNTKSEKLLEALADHGVNLKDISQNEINVRYDDELKQYVAEREMELYTESDSKTINGLFGFVEKLNEEIEINVHYLCLNEKNMTNELLKEAVNDSRAKAELICSLTNQTIVGIKEINSSHYYGNVPCFVRTKFEDSSEQKKLLSDQIGAHKITLSERLEIVWVIE